MTLNSHTLGSKARASPPPVKHNQLSPPMFVVDSLFFGKCDCARFVRACVIVCLCVQLCASLDVSTCRICVVLLHFCTFFFPSCKVIILLPDVGEMLFANLLKMSKFPDLLQKIFSLSINLAISKFCVNIVRNAHHNS